MMKALITGSNGFVGHYLKIELEKNNIEVIGMDMVGEAIHADFLDAHSVRDAVFQVKPDFVFHLAGQSSVGMSWQKPQLTFSVNVNGTINLLDAIRDTGRKTRIILIGSADEYGKVTEEQCPLTEETQPQPSSPYAISKYAQELMAKTYMCAYDMDIVLTRSFNHTGPGQRKGFVIPDFASQIAMIERGAPAVLSVGNLEARRDISDVRDIVKGYWLLAQAGTAGEVYNIGAGCAYSIKALLQLLLEMSSRKIEINEDTKKARPIDTPLVVSDISKVKNLGYNPRYSIEETLRDTLDYWRKTLEKRGAF